jgi:hypothetical protein
MEEFYLDGVGRIMRQRRKRRNEVEALITTGLEQIRLFMSRRCVFGLADVI